MKNKINDGYRVVIWQFILTIISLIIVGIWVSNNYNKNRVILLNKDMPGIGNFVNDSKDTIEVQLPNKKYPVYISWIYEYDKKKINITFITFINYPTSYDPIGANVPCYFYCGTNGEAMTPKKYWGVWDYGQMEDAGFKPSDKDLILKSFYEQSKLAIKYFYAGCSTYRDMIDNKMVVKKDEE